MLPCDRVRRRALVTTTGVTALFTALDIATGRIIGKCYGRHRTKEFHKFLSGSRTYHCRRSIAGPVCTENLIRVADVLKSPKLTE
jgi:hypothetical protein